MRAIVTDRVAWSVWRSVSPIEMPFGLWIRVGPGNNVLDGGPDLPWEGAFFGGEGAHCKLCKQGLFSVSCACTSDPIEMPFGMLSRVDSRNHVHIGRGNFEGKGMPRRRRHSKMSCAKVAEPIGMTFGLWVMESGWPKQACVRWGSTSPTGNGNLTKGRIATVDGRFNGIRQVAPVCISLHLIHPSVGPPESTTRTTSRSVQPLLHSSF